MTRRMMLKNLAAVMGGVVLAAASAEQNKSAQNRVDATATAKAAVAKAS